VPPGLLLAPGRDDVNPPSIEAVIGFLTIFN
jgi:hypothetical protein